MVNNSEKKFIVGGAPILAKFKMNQNILKKGIQLINPIFKNMERLLLYTYI